MCPEHLALAAPPIFDYPALKKRSRALDLAAASGLGGSPPASIKEWFLEDDNISHCAVQIVNDLAAGYVPEGIKSAIRSCRG